MINPIKLIVAMYRRYKDQNFTEDGKLMFEATYFVIMVMAINLLLTVTSFIIDLIK